MEERAVPIPFRFEAAADADGLWLLEIPFQITIVAVNYTLHTVTGSPTGANIDIQDDGVDVISAMALSAFTAGSVAEWLSKHMGGSEDAIEVAAGSKLEVDLNLSGGSSPTAGLNGVIWALLGALKG